MLCCSSVKKSVHCIDSALHLVVVDFAWLIPRINHPWLVRQSCIPQHRCRPWAQHQRCSTMTTSSSRSSSVLTSPPPLSVPLSYASAGSSTPPTASSSIVSASSTHPRIIGFYVLEWSLPNSPRFILMLPPQHLERTAFIRRARFSLETNQSDTIWTYIMDCRNGRVLTKRRNGSTGGLKMHMPLCPEIGMDAIPPFPSPELQHGYHRSLSQILSKEGVNSLSYFLVSMESAKYGIYRMSRVRVYMLKDGVWCLHTSASAHLPLPLMGINSVLVDSKIYMAAAMSYIIIFDLTTSSFSVMQLPQGVEFGLFKTMLSRADDYSSIYLIHAKELQIRIWLQKRDTWLLVDTICLVDMFANLRISGCAVEDYHIFLRLRQVGDNAEFVFLQMRQSVFYLDIKCRTLCKVHEMTKYDGSSCHINPLMMIWPPTFPANKVDPASSYNRRSTPDSRIGGHLSRYWRTIRRCATVLRWP